MTPRLGERRPDRDPFGAALGVRTRHRDAQLNVGAEVVGRRDRAGDQTVETLRHDPLSVVPNDLLSSLERSDGAAQIGQQLGYGLGLRPAGSLKHCADGWASWRLSSSAFS